MTQEEIIEGNKLIAFSVFSEDDIRDWVNDIGKPSDKFCLTTLKYHSSWDWLMPVVSKITKLGYEIVFEMKSNWDESTFSIYNPERGNELIDPYIAMEDYSPDNLLEYVWFSIVEFIKWYNKENK